LIGRRFGRVLAILGIAASDLLSSMLAHVPLGILTWAVVQMKRDWLGQYGQEGIEDDPALLLAILAAGMLFMALIPCVVGNVTLRRRSGIRWQWLATVAAVIIAIPQILEMTGHGLTSSLFHWFGFFT
jgi:hypothetical protein